jgi:hypothetical protein
MFRYRSPTGNAGPSGDSGLPDVGIPALHGAPLPARSAPLRGVVDPPGGNFEFALNPFGSKHEFTRTTELVSHFPLQLRPHSDEETRDVSLAVATLSRDTASSWYRRMANAAPVGAGRSRVSTRHPGNV